MKEYSDQEIEALYKDWREAQVPPMWEQIEQRLTPKAGRDTAEADGRNQESLQSCETAPASLPESEVQSRKAAVPSGSSESGAGRRKRFRTWQLASAAAAVALLLLAGPVWRLIQSGTSDSKSQTEEIQLVSDSAGGEESGREETDGGYDMEQSADSAADGASEMNGVEESMQEDTEFAKDAAETENGKSAEAFCCEITIKKVKALPDGMQMTASIAEPGNSPYEAGEEVTILYQGISYQKTDLVGTLRVQLQMEEKNLKLMEILP